MSERIDAGFRMESGEMPDSDSATAGIRSFGDDFVDYVEWRAQNPSDDLMTDLLNAEFEDETGSTRTLTRDEVLNYVGLLNAAGNETTTRLIGWTGKVLAEHADQRQELVDDPGLVPQAIEELLRFEAPSPVQARYVARDAEHPHDQAGMLELSVRIEKPRADGADLRPFAVLDHRRQPLRGAPFDVAVQEQQQLSP